MYYSLRKDSNYCSQCTNKIDVNICRRCIQNLYGILWLMIMSIQCVLFPNLCKYSLSLRWYVDFESKH